MRGQGPAIDRLISIEAVHRHDGGELPVDLRHPSLDGGPGGVADHAVESVIPDRSTMSGRKAEEAIDRLPLDRCPVPHRLEASR